MYHIIRDYKRCIQKEGCKLESVTRSSNLHLLLSKGPHQKVFYTALTPSDQRTMNNFRSEVRRWVKGLQDE